jgi:hypothetical protein
MPATTAVFSNATLKKISRCECERTNCIFMSLYPLSAAATHFLGARPLSVLARKKKRTKFSRNPLSCSLALAINFYVPTALSPEEKKQKKNGFSVRDEY